MAEIFPDQYFHIGGDETKGEGWLENPRIAAFMKKKGFNSPPELQSYFNQRLLPILTRHHKKMIGWDEILNPALPKDIMIQSWRGDASLADGATKGYAGILSAPYYLDAQKTSEMMYVPGRPHSRRHQADARSAAAHPRRRSLHVGRAAQSGDRGFARVATHPGHRRTLLVPAIRSRRPRHVPKRLRSALARTRKTSGLTHLSGPQRLRRNLMGAYDPEPLDVMAAVIEPVSFHERYHGQKTDSLTALDRLVDAVVADPPARQAIAREVDAVVNAANAGDRAAAEMALRHRFTQWAQAAPALESWAHRSVRLSDIDTRARQLNALAQVGLESLSWLDMHTQPAAAWQDAQLADHHRRRTALGPGPVCLPSRTAQARGGRRQKHPGAIALGAPGRRFWEPGNPNLKLQGNLNPGTYIVLRYI